MKDDFKGASELYDRVIHMDPTWSAFAHYYRAYCTILLKDNGYIRRAIDDLKAALSKFQAYKKRPLFCGISMNAFISPELYETNNRNTT